MTLLCYVTPHGTTVLPRPDDTLLGLADGLA